MKLNMFENANVQKKTAVHPVGIHVWDFVKVSVVSKATSVG